MSVSYRSNYMYDMPLWLRTKYSHGICHDIKNTKLMPSPVFHGCPLQIKNMSSRGDDRYGTFQPSGGDGGGI